jgi:hypothetical protein
MAGSVSCFVGYQPKYCSWIEAVEKIVHNTGSNKDGTTSTFIRLHDWAFCLTLYGFDNEASDMRLTGGSFRHRAAEQ